MVNGVKGARRRMGGGATRRGEVSNKTARVRAAVADAKATRDRPEKRLSHDQQQLVNQANPGDARSLLDLLVSPASEKAGRLKLKGEIKAKPKRANCAFITSDGTATTTEPSSKRRRVQGGADIVAPLAQRGSLCTGDDDLLADVPLPEAAEEDPADAQPTLPAYEMWRRLGVNDALLEALKENGFEQPFEVQQRTFSEGLRFDKDVLAAAQTGSGKTLAFGLPIIQRIMEKHAASPVPFEKRVIDCLVITPTRELAMQVHNHLKPFVEAAGLSAACIVGGMSDEKQLRLLNRSKKYRPHIVIATPGRLHGLLEDGDSDYLDRSITKALEYLVVDEADKMIQAKHFEEMGDILERIRDREAPEITLEKKSEMMRGISVVKRCPQEENPVHYATNAYEEFDSVEDFLRVWKKEAKESPFASSHIEGVNFNDLAKDMGITGAAEGEGEDQEEEMEEEDLEEGLPEEAEAVEEGVDAEMEEMEEDEEDEEGEEAEEGEGEGEGLYQVPVPDRLKVFITSATLTLEAKHHEGGNRIAKKHKAEAEKQGQQAEEPKGKRSKKGKRNQEAEAEQEEADNEAAPKVASVDMIAEICESFRLDKARCSVFDCTPDSLMVDSLRQACIYCLDDEKELTTYYFLLRHTGRTIIFVNAISTLRRLTSILSNLGLTIYALHSEMQQRQRLKNIDRLRDNEDCVVVATDVAARGLDIKGIQHVLHYQFPRNLDTYVHRCGRTARCKQAGFSLSLVSPEEKSSYKKMCESLKAGNGQGLPSYSVDHQLLQKLRDRLSLAKQLDKALHKDSKVKVHNTWLEKNAKEMDLRVEDSLRDQSMDDQRQAKIHREKISLLKRQLTDLLATPLMQTRGQFLHTGLLRAQEDAAAEHAKKLQRVVYGAGQQKRAMKK